MVGRKLYRSEGDNNLSPLRLAWTDSLDESSRALLARDSQCFLHQSLSTPCLNAIRKAEGIWIEDIRGHRYMDFHGNNVHHIGYGHPRLISAIKTQLDELTFSPRRYTNDVAVALATKLAELAPGDLGKVLFSTGGSDAIEMALKVARAATGRFKTISFWDSFHGAGFGALSIGGEELFRTGPAGPLLPGTEHVAPFACYRCPYGYDDDSGRPRLDVCKSKCAQFIDYVLEKEGDVAAVIAEPVRSVPYIPPPQFWQTVRAACDAHGALLIFDEIPNGLGKTGRFFSSEHFGVVPDISVLGKSLGGGVVPIAAMIAKPELDIAGDRALGHYTHEKNPVSCRAALTTIEIIEEEGLVQHAASVGAHALGRLQELKARHRLVGDVRGLGLLLGVELVLDRDEKTPAVDASERVFYAALNRGLGLKVTMGNVLTLSPPLIITMAEMDRAIGIIDEVLGEFERGCL
jgi:4-aminobutyrate aminotransferase